jgi:hypothetical protein
MDSGTATLLCRIQMYQEPIPDELVIYAGHVVPLRQSDPRHTDRARHISERNAQRKQFYGKYEYVGGGGGNKKETGGRQQIFGKRNVKI